MNKEPQRKEQSTFVTIFAIWNSMVGGGLVSHPWAFSESGILLSLIINFAVMMVCFYTCNLIMKWGKGDDDFSVTMQRFFGAKGHYASTITTMAILYGGAIIYYQLLTQTLFPFVVGIIDIISGTYTPSVSTEVDFTKFSLAWTSIIIFIPLYLIVCMKDRSIFIKMSSFGVLFIIIQIMFVVVIFFYSISNTKYSFTWIESENIVEGQNIAMFKSNFQSLTGMLAAGYYLHQLGLPVILDNKNQENNTRDIFWGYFLVFLTYCIIGVCGFLGFSGEYFQGAPIMQNILNMFATSHPIATFIRVCSFTQIFSVYPLLFHVVRVNFTRTFFENGLEGKGFYLYNLLASLPWAILAIWYPRVGNLLGYAGGVVGLFTIYLLPVALHLKRSWMEINQPLRLKKLESRAVKEYEVYNGGSSVNQNKDDLTEKLIEEENENKTMKKEGITNGRDIEKKSNSQLWVVIWLDSWAILFGVVIFILQFI